MLGGARPLRRARLERRAARDAIPRGDITRLVEEGNYRVSVERTLPLRDAAEPWRLSREGHTQGKLVLAVP